MHVTTSSRTRLLPLLAALVGLVALLATPASAHSQLLSSSPAPGEAVETPTTVTFVFNEALIDAGTEVSVTDAAGEVLPLTPSYPEPTTVSVELPRLPDGAATVAWRVVSADGHPIEGVLDIVVANPPEPSPSPEPSTSPEPSPSPEPSTASPSPSPSPEVTDTALDEASGGLPVWLVIALAVIVVAAIGAAVVVRRR